MEIFITAQAIPSGELIERLESGCAGSGVELLLRKPADGFRTLDTTVVVALVTSTGAALGALATAVVGIAREKKMRRITLRDKDGRSIDYPADLSEGHVQALIETLHRMEARHIEIT